MWDLLQKNKDVQRLWLAQVMSFIGDWAALIALGGLLLERTGSVAWSTVPTIAASVGMLIGLTIAWIGDSYPKRSVIIVTDLARGLIYIYLGLYRAPIPLLFLLLIVAGVMTTVFNGARGAIWQEVVKPDQLQAVRSLSMATFAATTAIGSAVGAGLWLTVGAEKALLLNAATFIFSGWLVSRLKVAIPTLPAARINTHVLAGQVWAIPNLRRLIMFSTFGSLAAETSERLVIPYAHTYANNAFASVLATTTALGSLAGTVCITRLVLRHFEGMNMSDQVVPRLKLGVMLQVFLYLVVLAGLALPPNYLTAALVYVGIGIFFGHAAVIQPAAIKLIPEGRQAGTITLIEATNYTALLIGSAIAGASLKITSPRTIIAVMISLTLISYGLYYLNRFRSRHYQVF